MNTSRLTSLRIIGLTVTYTGLNRIRLVLKLRHDLATGGMARQRVVPNAPMYRDSTMARNQRAQPPRQSIIELPAHMRSSHDLAMPPVIVVDRPSRLSDKP